MTVTVVWHDWAHADDSDVLKIYINCVKVVTASVLALGRNDIGTNKQDGCILESWLIFLLVNHHSPTIVNIAMFHIMAE